MTAIAYEQSPYHARAVRPAEILFQPKPNASPRLNVILPNYFKAYAFGGIAGAMELAAELSAGYSRVRFVSQAPLGALEEMYDFQAHAAPTCMAEDASLAEGPLPCHQREVFLCTLWTSVSVWEAHAEHMRKAGKSPTPFYYFIQDYEPGFHPFGYRHVLAQASYRHASATHAIFNSLELRDYFHSQGLGFTREYALSPSLNPTLRGYLEAQDSLLAEKLRDRFVILAYGRPNEERNCFLSLTEGLARFCAEAPADVRDNLTILSAGQPHEDLLLPGGVVMQSLGKLTLPAYIGALEAANIGVSLMASPHPSYPPLEMATFGLVTITNDFETKALAPAHPLLRCLDLPTPENVADALHQAVAEVRQAPEGRQRAQLPETLSPLAWRENVRNAGIEHIKPGKG